MPNCPTARSVPETLARGCQIDMKSLTVFRLLSSAPLLLLRPGCGAQTQVDLRTQWGDVDFSGGASAKPFRTDTVLPGTCSPGQTFFVSAAAAGANFYARTSANTWTLEGPTRAKQADIEDAALLMRVRTRHKPSQSRALTKDATIQLPEVPYSQIESSIVETFVLLLLVIHLWRAIKSEFCSRRCVLCEKSVAPDEHAHHLEICGLRMTHKRTVERALDISLRSRRKKDRAPKN
jgi:hypothetical protein